MTALYLHWPFCASKCPYCDFNSHVREKINHHDWVQAYQHEIERYQALFPNLVLNSIFFGGGTPSLMPVETLNAMLETVKQKWTYAPGIEITLEANPSSADASRFKGYQQAGVNRLSLGVQSFKEETLRYLGRQHSVDEAHQAILCAQSIFDRVSFDLIYACEGQTLLDWKRELNQALSYSTTHLSLYQLTIEPGTVFATRFNRGDVQLPPEEMASDFYIYTQERLNAAGLMAYEISNHAKPGDECWHNLNYWRYGDYIGIGPGAHGRIMKDNKRLATYQKKAPEAWLKQMNEIGHGDNSVEILTHQEIFEERLMMGLRIGEGVVVAPDEMCYLNHQKIQWLQAEGLLKDTPHIIQTSVFPEMRLNALMHAVLI